MSLLISFGIYSTPKLSNYVTLSPFTYKIFLFADLHEFLLIFTDQDLLRMPQPLF